MTPPRVPRPNTISQRKPQKKAVLAEVAENMAHFSRVARKPVWFSFDDLWDIHKETRLILTGKAPRSMTSYQGFPSLNAFGIYAAKHPNIVSRRIAIKINHNLPKTSDNVREQAQYAYIHAGQDAAEGVNFGGVS